MRKGAARQTHVDFVGGSQRQHLAQVAKNGVKSQR